jgi:putative DNA primase/helicase
MSAPATAAELAQALGGQRAGKGFRALCPAHDDRNPSLSINETKAGKILLKCWHGCEQQLVISELKRRGLWTSEKRQAAQKPRREDDRAKQNMQLAGEIWRATVPIGETVVKHYLQKRGIVDLPDGIDGVLRFHPNCPFRKRERHPCMVALWRNIQSDKPQAIHRTALTPEGEKIDRMSLGPTQDAAIKLYPDVTDTLTIGEGIETALSGAALGYAPAWAVGDAGHIEKFPVLAGVDRLVILVDRDSSGRGQNAASQCALRWLSANRKVRRIFPDLPVEDADLNDVLCSMKSEA